MCLVPWLSPNQVSWSQLEPVWLAEQIKSSSEVLASHPGGFSLTLNFWSQDLANRHTELCHLPSVRSAGAHPHHRIESCPVASPPGACVLERRRTTTAVLRPPWELDMLQPPTQMPWSKWLTTVGQAEEDDDGLAWWHTRAALGDGLTRRHGEADAVAGRSCATAHSPQRAHPPAHYLERIAEVAVEEMQRTTALLTLAERWVLVPVPNPFNLGFENRCYKIGI